MLKCIHIYIHLNVRDIKTISDINNEILFTNALVYYKF